MDYILLIERVREVVNQTRIKRICCFTKSSSIPSLNEI